MSVVRLLFGIFAFLGGGILGIALGLALIALKIAVICGVIYFFLAAGGIVPPIDVVPFVPYV